MIRNAALIVFLCIVTLLNTTHSQTQNKGEWETLFEKSGFMSTPRYAESMAYFKKFEKSSPYVKMTSFGISPQGRSIEVLILSKDNAFTASAAKKTGKPIFVINNGIHAGEIEGKDATMLLLREILITKEKAQLLDKVIIMVIPIFSVDGHERFAAGNRINQNGPIEMGWRTTAQNLNLNRDWLKADAPEMQAMLKLMTLWQPDYFVDCHTTDGADFQYAANYGFEKFQNMYKGSADEISEVIIPQLTKYCEDNGFLVAPYVGFKDENIAKGITDWPGTPRFSTGYFAAQNRISLLIETHMLKPYKIRVYATKAMLEASLEYVAANGAKLMKLNRTADEETVRDYLERQRYFPVQFTVSNTQSTPFLFRGIKHYTDSSKISGKQKIVYTAEKFDTVIPYFHTAIVTDSIRVPYAYIIPREYALLAERLRLHGVEMEVVSKERAAIVSKYRFKDIKFNNNPYEGRHPVNAGYTIVNDTVRIPEGSFLIYTDQRTVKLLMYALEPKSGDSFLRWGFMNAIFEQKEYFEEYVMEKVALEMINEQPELEKAFSAQLKNDSTLAGDARKRLQWFYERSPYYGSPEFSVEIKHKASKADRRINHDH